jgi:hypothetical protein
MGGGGKSVLDTRMAAVSRLVLLIENPILIILTAGRNPMEYLQEIVNSESLIRLFDLPPSLRTRKVEVIIRPAETEIEPKSSGESAFGCLHRFANPSKIASEKGAWERAAVKKYVKN